MEQEKGQRILSPSYEFTWNSFQKEKLMFLFLFNKILSPLLFNTFIEKATAETDHLTISSI